ncbi:chorismate mutase family protein [Robbsia andropogonis]|uniref:hypothetical protein n=1 Tax=Robbsia andropogonis TaxID=28092 RepID=UPI000464D033|nr:hypothetical protein [Robbsia andropogonis]
MSLPSSTPTVPRQVGVAAYASRGVLPSSIAQFRSPRSRQGAALAALLLVMSALVLPIAPARAQAPELKETMPRGDRDNTAQAAFLNIVSVVSSRLALSQTFAAWAWQQQHAGKSPGDVQRDDETEQGLMKMAPHYGLAPDFADPIIRDQTIASEQLQRTLFAQWQQGGGVPHVDAPAYQIARGDLYRVSQSLMGALTQVQPFRDRDDCPMLLSKAITRWTTDMASVSADQRKVLPAALAHVCHGGIGATA